MSQISINTQKGFTLIELIMVIVILGILSAFAIPKFADLGDSARTAVLQGARASVSSGNAIARSASLATSNTTSVTLEGTAYALTNGYPTIVTIQTIAGVSSADYTTHSDTTTTPNQVAFIANGTVAGGDCFVYIESASSSTPSSISAIGAWTDNGVAGTLDAADVCSGVTLQ